MRWVSLQTWHMSGISGINRLQICIHIRAVLIHNFLLAISTAYHRDTCNNIQIWICDEGNMQFYGSEATILIEAMLKSILLLKIHKTHIARHLRSIFALLYVTYLWSIQIGLWIHILLSNNNMLWCYNSTIWHHNSSTMMTGNIGKFWLVNMVFWVSMQQYWRSCDHESTNQLWLFTFDI